MLRGAPDEMTKVATSQVDEHMLSTISVTFFSEIFGNIPE
jgi:hypothetical protein